MKTSIAIWLIILCAAMGPGPVWGETPSQIPKTQSVDASPGLDTILSRIEERYTVSGFSAHFFQTSILKAMDITDTATGKIYVKHPGKMRWEYENPERQIIISDGFQLWIYRPDDGQVMVGKAPDFFGDGKGASFLTDIGKLRENFEITLENRPDTDDHHLKLVPHNQKLDFTEVYLTVSWATFHIEEITTLNAYGDETRITLSEVRFDRQIDDALFRFVTPEGVEVLNME